MKYTSLEKFYSEYESVSSSAQHSGDVLDYLTQSEHKARQNGDTYLLAAILNELGAAHRIRGNFERAQGCYTQLLSIMEGEHHLHFDSLSKANAYLNLGSLYCACSQFNRAEELFSQGLQRLECAEMSEEDLVQEALLYSRCALLNNRSTAYRKTGRYFQARADIQQAYSILDTIEQNFHIDLKIQRLITAVQELELFLDAGKFEEADELASSCESILETADLKVRTDIHLVYFYAALARLRYYQAAYKEALGYYQKAYDLQLEKLGESIFTRQLAGEIQKLIQLLKKHDYNEAN